MTVEQQVDALATSVDQLKAAVVTKKATLDATVVDAQSATAQAQAAKANALSARDQAGAFKDAAYTAAQSAASAVAYQDLTALAAEKAVTAVDVFIYDTSKDSDGGAWRHRCAGTSWFNEPLNTAIRGARREFPAVAVIVAEGQKVTIYDGDDPTLPMWMVFNQVPNNHLWRSPRPATCIAMGNGILAIGLNDATNAGTCGVISLEFVGDRIVRRSVSSSGGSSEGGVFPVGIAGRHTQPMTASAPVAALVNSFANDVAMTVLPDAPIDPATGLPVPTIALATAGGVSVINDDGTVADSADTNRMAVVEFFPDGGLCFTRSASGNVFNYATVNEYTAGNGFGASRTSVASLYPTLAFSALASPARIKAIGDGLFAFGGGAVGLVNAGLALHKIAPSSGSGDWIKGMSALLTTTFNSGWLPGAIRGAFLADTDDADLVGTELVTNGTFETDVSGWTAEADAGSVWNADGSATATPTSGFRNVSQSIATVAGRAYRLSAKVSGASGGRLRCGTGVANAAFVDIMPTAEPTVYERWFIATGATTVITFFGPGDGVGSITVDDISLRPADADRSVNNRGLVVNGTITRAPVATGAELVGYAGGGANFLSRDFAGAYTGHSSFALIGWYFGGTAGFWDWYETVGGGTSATFLDTYMDPTSKSFRLVWQGRTSIILQGDGPSIEGRWAQIALCFTGAGGLQFYQDGRLIKTYATVPSPALHELRVLPGGGSRMAMLRLTEPIPTADQIRRIYEDEKALFQENAACTLYGASDAVTALAHDPDTGLLHVGTSAGRSVFKGLRRVANTTVPVGAAIAAAGGMVVEE